MDHSSVEKFINIDR